MMMKILWLILIFFDLGNASIGSLNHEESQRLPLKKRKLSFTIFDSNEDLHSKKSNDVENFFYFINSLSILPTLDLAQQNRESPQNPLSKIINKDDQKICFTIFDYLTNNGNKSAFLSNLIRTSKQFHLPIENYIENKFGVILKSPYEQPCLMKKMSLFTPFFHYVHYPINLIRSFQLISSFTTINLTHRSTMEIFSVPSAHPLKVKSLKRAIDYADSFGMIHGNLLRSYNPINIGSSSVKSLNDFRNQLELSHLNDPKIYWELNLLISTFRIPNVFINNQLNIQKFSYFCFGECLKQNNKTILNRILIKINQVELGKYLYEMGLKTSGLFFLNLFLKSNNQQILDHIACYFENKNALTESLEFYKRLITINPADADSYYKAGHLLFRLNKFKTSFFHFQKSCQLNPYNIAPLNQLGAHVRQVHNPSVAYDLHKICLESLPLHGAMSSEIRQQLDLQIRQQLFIDQVHLTDPYILNVLN